MTTGKDLIALGYEPARWFSEALAIIAAEGHTSNGAIREICDGFIAAIPAQIPLTNAAPLHVYSTEEGENREKCYNSLTELSRTPTIERVLMMPDACPAGRFGEITVGGVAAARGAIHPGMHSADICCSMMVSDYGDVDPKDLLNAFHGVTHFGMGGRIDQREVFSDECLEPFNRLQRDFSDIELLERDKKSRDRLIKMAWTHAGTQGDGNHFAFVGTSEQTGRTVLVTHHGSRGVGAMLYKIGMAVAEEFRRKLSPETLAPNAWIPADTREGAEYWAALQLVRDWTKANHVALHSAAGRALGIGVSDRWWNEHNFVFQEDDLFWHAKGATPVKASFLPDTDGRMAIPMNMAEPILIVKSSHENDFGFAPHGAGRMTSRTAHIRGQGDRPVADIVAEETAGVDARFFSGKPDISELPSAYKDARRVQSDMDLYGLAQVEDRIMSYGCIMAGEQEQFWRKKKEVAA